MSRESRRMDEKLARREETLIRHGLQVATFRRGGWKGETRPDMVFAAHFTRKRKR